MGAWSGEPFGNDEAADWAWELDDATDWGVVEEALDDAIDSDASDDLVGIRAIAAAEVVAQGLGNATQDDAYTESVARFVERVGAPSPELVEKARTALAAATAPDSGIALLWEDDPTDWDSANAMLKDALA